MKMPGSYPEVCHLFFTRGMYIDRNTITMTKEKNENFAHILYPTLIFHDFNSKHAHIRMRACECECVFVWKVATSLQSGQFTSSENSNYHHLYS